jgi:regulatory protein
VQAGIITALEIQKRNKERVNVYLDGEYAFSLPLMEAARLKKGQTLSLSEVGELRTEDEISRAVDRAVRLLARRPRSVSEVRKNLTRKETPEPVIDSAIARLTQLGYLDDEAFARYWMENRDQFKPRGPRALRYELRQKGVARDIIEQVVSDVDPADAAYRAAQDRARRMRGSTRFDFENRVGGFLQRRGFSYGTARDAINRIADELAVSDPEFFREVEE